MIMGISKSSTIIPQDNNIAQNTHLMDINKALPNPVSSSSTSSSSFSPPIVSPVSTSPSSSSSLSLPPSSSAPNNTCGNCGTSKTPLWRRTADGLLTCNACGLYYKANSTHRPVNLKRPPTVVPISVQELQGGSCEGDGKCNGTGGTSSCRGCPAFNNRVLVPSNDTHSTTERDNSPDSSQNSNSISGKDGKTDSLAVACSNCGTTVTPLWRRDGVGNTICNACGLYYKMHGSHRPVVMKKATIKRRKRTAINPEDAPPSLEITFDAATVKKKKKVKLNRLSSPVTIMVNPVDIPNDHTSTTQIKMEGVMNNRSPMTLVRPSLVPPNIQLPSIPTTHNLSIPPISSLTSERSSFQLPRPETSSYHPQNSTHQHHTLPPLRYMESGSKSLDSANIQALATKPNFAPPAIDFTSTFMGPQRALSPSPILPTNKTFEFESGDTISPIVKDEDHHASRANSSKMSVSLLLNNTAGDN